jgi:hypothetical protein
MWKWTSHKAVGGGADQSPRRFTATLLLAWELLLYSPLRLLFTLALTITVRLAAFQQVDFTSLALYVVGIGTSRRRWSCQTHGLEIPPFTYLGIAGCRVNCNAKSPRTMIERCWCQERRSIRKVSASCSMCG